VPGGFLPRGCIWAGRELGFPISRLRAPWQSASGARCFRATGPAAKLRLDSSFARGNPRVRPPHAQYAQPRLSLGGEFFAAQLGFDYYLSAAPGAFLPIDRTAEFVRHQRAHNLVAQPRAALLAQRINILPT